MHNIWTMNGPYDDNEISDEPYAMLNCAPFLTVSTQYAPLFELRFH